MRWTASVTRSRPSFAGRGDGQVWMSSTQEVSRQLLTPISGITATPRPFLCSRKYQGRAGVFQANCVVKPDR